MMKWETGRFAGWFSVDVLVLSVVLQNSAVNRVVIEPFTQLVARAASAILTLTGESTRVSGTLIVATHGYSINIVNGCNGLYVMLIVMSAVLAFPCTLKQKLLGLVISCTSVQLVNMARILSLYYIGLMWPSVFDEFHVYVWQIGVIVLSMATWIWWVEVIAAKEARSRSLNRA